MIEVRLFAGLRQGRQKIYQMEPDSVKNVQDIMDVLQIQRKEVNILLINGFHQKPETEVKDGDIVSLFPLWEAADMQARYQRNIPALTEEECLILRKKRVLVVGCGGLGGHIIDQLARIGVGSVRVVDGDVFEESNLNRQLLSQVPLLGVSKAAAAAQHIARVNPDVQTEAVEAFLTEENAAALISGCDIVLDALDNVASRKILAAACRDAGIPYVYGAIQGWIAQAAVSMPEDRLIETLFPEDVIIRDKSVLSFTPALCAAMQVSLCVKWLTGRAVETGTVYYFDLLHQEFECIPLA